MIKAEAARWKEEFDHVWRRTLIMTILAPFLLVVGVMVTGVRDNLSALWTLPETTEVQFQATQDAINSNTRAINQLRIPAKIFELSERSGPVEGFCKRGADCAYNIRVRRLPNALQCRVAPPFEYFYLEETTNEEYSITRTSPGQARNLGTSYVNIDQTFSTPLSLTGLVEFCIRGKYRGCPGQTDQEQVITQNDECVGVSIRD